MRFSENIKIENSKYLGCACKWKYRMGFSVFGMLPPTEIMIVDLPSEYILIGCSQSESKLFGKFDKHAVDIKQLPRHRFESDCMRHVGGLETGWLLAQGDEWGVFALLFLTDFKMHYDLIDHHLHSLAMLVLLWLYVCHWTGSTVSVSIKMENRLSRCNTGEFTMWICNLIGTFLYGFSVVWHRCPLRNGFTRGFSNKIWII